MADEKPPPTPGEPPPPAGEKPAPGPAQPVDEGWLEQKIRTVIESVLGERDPKDGAPTPAERPGPTTDRQTEDDFRGRVRGAVEELERSRAHDKAHEDSGKPAPQPPQPETKPWRNRMWG